MTIKLNLKNKMLIIKNLKKKILNRFLFFKITIGL